LYWSVEGQARSGRLEGVEMNLASNEPMYDVVRSNLHTDTEDAPKSYQTLKVLYAKQPTTDRTSGRIKG
jgi:hypothetical protein